jgi:hypothetical protein
MPRPGTLQHRPRGAPTIRRWRRTPTPTSALHRADANLTAQPGNKVDGKDQTDPMGVDGHRLGIDFGTSSTVAVLAGPDGREHQLLFGETPVMPSSVYLDPNDVLLVGADAVRASRARPESFEPNPKARIDDGTILLGDAEIPVADVIAAVLRRVLDEAVRIAGAPIRSTVLTHPVGWATHRRGVLLRAAATAGLTDVSLVAEPVAAAAYFVQTLGNAVPVGSCVVVYDLGAGTLDASVVRRTPEGYTVLAEQGLPDAGGLDLDAAIFAYLGAVHTGPLWERLTQPRTTADRRASRLLWDDVRNAKEALSRASSTQVFIPLLDTDAVLGREQLEQLARPLLERTVSATRATIRASGVTPTEIAAVFLVGGASRMPLVATMLHRVLGLAPTAIEHPQLVVAGGSLRVPTTQHGTVLLPIDALPDAGFPVSSPPGLNWPISAAPSSPAAGYTLPPPTGQTWPSAPWPDMSDLSAQQDPFPLVPPEPPTSDTDPQSSAGLSAASGTATPTNTDPLGPPPSDGSSQESGRQSAVRQSPSGPQWSAAGPRYPVGRATPAPPVPPRPSTPSAVPPSTVTSAEGTPSGASPSGTTPSAGSLPASSRPSTPSASPPAATIPAAASSSATTRSAASTPASSPPSTPSAMPPSAVVAAEGTPSAASSPASSRPSTPSALPAAATSPAGIPAGTDPDAALPAAPVSPSAVGRVQMNAPPPLRPAYGHSDIGDLDQPPNVGRRRFLQILAGVGGVAVIGGIVYGAKVLGGSGSADSGDQNGNGTPDDQETTGDTSTTDGGDTSTPDTQETTPTDGETTDGDSTPTDGETTADEATTPDTTST